MGFGDPDIPTTILKSCQIASERDLNAWPQFLNENIKKRTFCSGKNIGNAWRILDEMQRAKYRPRPEHSATFDGVHIGVVKNPVVKFLELGKFRAFLSA